MEKKEEKKGLRHEVVGLCSRIDYGSKGYRPGLIQLGFQIFQDAGYRGLEGAEIF